MSKEALAKVVQRSISDAAFRRQLATDPTGALRGYDLSADESAAIRSGDSRRLTALGVEQRMSKAFTLGGESSTVDAVSKSVSSDLGASLTGAITTGNFGAAGSSTLTPGDGANTSGALTGADGSTAQGAFTAGGGASGSNALTSGDASDTDPVIADTTGAARDAAIIPGNPAHALSGEGDEYLPQFNNTLTEGDTATQSVIVVDEAGGGASMPGEAASGPNLQE